MTEPEPEDPLALAVDEAVSDVVERIAAPLRLLLAAVAYRIEQDSSPWRPDPDELARRVRARCR